MKLAQFIRMQYGLFQRLFGHAAPVSAKERGIIEEFHKLYYDAALTGGGYEDTYWLGSKVLKCPLDLWIYQEIIHQIQPDFIIETGTCEGGSAFFMAAVCDYIGRGEIITIDIAPSPHRPEHKRIRYLTGSSVADEIVENVRKAVTKSTVLVILDSDHSQQHVAKELNLFSPLVTKGSYLIVEDTNLNGHPINPEHGPGPMEAVEDFLKHNPAFQIDKSKEKFFMTFNPRGFLKRLA